MAKTIKLPMADLEQLLTNHTGIRLELAKLKRAQENNEREIKTYLINQNLTEALTINWSRLRKLPELFASSSRTDWDEFG